MRTNIHLKGVKLGHLATGVDLEVVPRGIYVINGEPYELTGQPTFHIQGNKLVLVELTVEKYVPGPEISRRPTVSVGPTI